MTAAFEIRPLAGALGAEIFGVDLSRALSPDTVARLRRALLDHLVIFFREQPLALDRYLAFAKLFGEPAEYPFVKGPAEFPEIIAVEKLEHETVNFGGIWHTDTTYLETPSMATLLLARKVPPAGGDTLFANMYLAYESLSPAMRAMLAGLKAVNSSVKSATLRTREVRVAAAPGGEAQRVFENEHPVVRTHPETGRKALYVNAGHTERFSGMSAEESAPLLDFLFRHQVKPEFTCRFRWEPGSLAFWDNRATQHNPINDYHGHHRLMHRITLAGDRPR